MSRRIVYLAGSIDKDRPDHIQWRIDAKKFLEVEGFKVLDPVREEVICNITEYPEDNPLLHRDVQDILRSDIILMRYCPHPGDRVSSGTLIELGMTHMAGGKLIAFVCDEPTIYLHPSVRAIVTKHFLYTNEAVDYIIKYWRE